jgi:CBS-domain-containing membrane protein
MNVIADFGRYLWKFFVGDSFQLIGLAVAFAIVGLLARPLGGWSGLLAFVLVLAVVWIDVFRRAAAGQKW